MRPVLISALRVLLSHAKRSWNALGETEGQDRNTKIGDLKPGSENVVIRGRVISTTPPRTIQTRSGPRTISEAVVGDETGRVKVTLWGKHAGALKEGEAVEIKNAWTSAYKGEVQVNASAKTEIRRIEDLSVPSAEEIPNESPKAPEGYRPPREGYGGFRGGYRRGPRRGGE